MAEEFVGENNDRYVVEGNILEIWSWTGTSSERFRLDLIDPVEYKGKWGTHMISIGVSSHKYSITDAGDRSQELANWLEAARSRSRQQ